MHSQEREDLLKTIRLISEHINGLHTAVKDIHDYLSHLKNEKDLDNLTARVKQLEEAYAELLLTGKADE